MIKHLHYLNSRWTKKAMISRTVIRLTAIVCLITLALSTVVYAADQPSSEMVSDGELASPAVAADSDNAAITENAEAGHIYSLSNEAVLNGAAGTSGAAVFPDSVSKFFTNNVMSSDIFTGSSETEFYYFNYASESDTSRVLMACNPENGTVRRMLPDVPEISTAEDFYHDGDDLYYITNTYNNGYKVTVCRLKLSTEEVSVVMEAELGGKGSSVAIDRKGRTYLSTYGQNGYELSVFGSDGIEIAGSSELGTIRDIIGVDAENGNIFYTSESNWVYWGYDHSMRSLRLARFNDDGTFETNESYITLLFQNYYREHSGSAEMTDGRYISVMSTFSDGVLFVLDSRKVSPSNVIQGTTSIDLITSGVEVSSINLDSDDAVVFGTKTGGTVKPSSSGYYDIGTCGTRSIYYGQDNKLVYVSGDCEMSLANADDGSNTGKIATEYPVYKAVILGNRLITVEEEDNDGTYNFYVEQFLLNEPSSVMISGPSSMAAGGSGRYTAEFDSDILKETVFTSSDSGVLSVDEMGYASAWKKGTVTVTVSSADGKLKDSMSVKVTGKTAVLDIGATVTIGGRHYSNSNRNNYSSYGGVVTSYLTEISETQLMRTEWTGAAVQADYLNQDGTIASSKTIPKELDLFGGFYAGSKYYYLVFGQKNTDEDNSLEVLRAVKYSKSWKRISACSISNINTYIPFDAGSLRMDENNGILYIHTCHEMYKSEDGYHHQANMTFEIKESDMTLKDQYSDVMNLSYGYVSHSFNQFIKISNGVVYRADHGDAYPRGIAVTAYPVGGSMTSPSFYGSVTGFEGNTGQNYTGASLGGFEVSGSHLLAAYSLDSAFGNNLRNIMIGTVSLEDHSTGTVQITEHAAGENITCYTPQLVKIDDWHFLLMWIEYNNGTGEQQCAIAQIDGSGHLCGDIVYTDKCLSDCQPIVLSTGQVCWYSSDGTKMRLYRIDPYNLSAVKETTVTAKPASFTYNGSAWTPSVTVKYGKTTLKEGTDYKITSVTGNVDPGTGHVSVQGIGKYSGMNSASFLVCYTDVPSTHNFKQAVYWATDMGIAAGYSGNRKGLFGVGDNITRGQVVMMLWRAAGKPEPASNKQTFKDVPVSHNFFKAVQWAVEQGITGGYTGARKGQFGSSDDCTRGQIVTFLWRFAGQPDPWASGWQRFSDVPSDHNFYKAIEWAAENSITTGFSDGTFGVNKTCTRGQCVTFLYRLIGK